MNDAWGTAFGAWGEVRPLRLPEAVETGRIASWVDHRRVMDRIWTNFEKHKIASARKLDPHAEGFADVYRSWETTLDSWGGIDYWLLLDEVVAGAAHIEPYLVSFVPPERRHLVWRRGSGWAPSVLTGHIDLWNRRGGPRRNCVCGTVALDPVANRGSAPALPAEVLDAVFRGSAARILRL